MTDFSTRGIDVTGHTAGTDRTLTALRDDEEIIAAVTLNLYPEWTAVDGDAVDAELENGRATWHGIVDELTGAR